MKRSDRIALRREITKIATSAKASPGAPGPKGDTGAAGSVADGDKGDITVSASGATWTIDAGTVTSTKMGGDVTVAGKALLTAADAAAQRTALSLGALASQDTTLALITATAPGSVAVLTARTMLQYERLTLASTDRLTSAGTGRTLVLDFGEDAARGPQGELAPTGTVILGTPKSPTMSFTVLSDYELDLTRRVTLNGTTRATLRGNANLVLQNAPANSGRITLTGRG